MMATLRELVGKRSEGGAGARFERAARGQRRRWGRSAVAALGALMMLVGSGGAAWSYASSSGWVDGYGRSLATGNGLVLTEFYSVGDNATFRSKWAGAYSAGAVSANTPAGVATNLYCIESGATIAANYSYSWTTSTDVRARYLMWLGNYSWNNPDGRAAIQYLLYADVFPTRGSNNNGTSFDYESRIWNHPDFTAQAKAYVNSFRALTTGQMHNSQATLQAESLGGVPTNGQLDGIGVTNAWGAYVPGLAYTVTITGPAVFNSTGTNTVTGTTTSSLANDRHPWTATAGGDVSFTITYTNADRGALVHIGSGAGSQDMVGGGTFAPLDFEDPVVPVAFMFRPGGDTEVLSPTAEVGDVLEDTFTPAAIDGTSWAIDGGAYVPVTYDWALYDAGEVIPTSTSATAPAEWTLLETTQVVATAPGVPITSAFTSTAEAGHAYVFVVSFSNANQPLATQGWFLADWSDAYGVEDEVIFAPTTVTATSTATSTTRGSDLALLDEVTFSGFPSDHGSFTGTSVFGADVATVQQRLYFFQEGVEDGVADTNLAAAELVCDVTVPATNGTHQVDEACAVARRDAWGQLIAGTYVWTSTFAGDGRTAAFSTSVTDTAEQVTIVNDPMAITTTAQQAAATLDRDSTIEVWDRAAVTGVVPVGSTLEFSLYQFASLGAPVCDASTLIVTLDPTAALSGAGTYESERHLLKIPDAAGIGFVETVYDVDGNVTHQGVCGALSETLPIARADDTGDDTTTDLAFTGVNAEPEIRWSVGLLVGGVALVALAASGVLTRRRQA